MTSCVYLSPCAGKQALLGKRGACLFCLTLYLKYLAYSRCSIIFVRWMDGKMDGWEGGWMDGWEDGWMDGWMEGRMGGWMGLE